jgi:hypothetical protein
MQPSTANRHAAAGSSWRRFWPVGVALAIRLALWMAIPATRLASDEDGYVPAGLALLATGTQDLFWPPGTGWIVAAVAWLAGPSVHAIRLAWIAMDAACLIAIGVLARQLAPAAGFDAAAAARVGRYAMLGYAIYLPAVSFSQFATSEIPALLQTLLILVLVSSPSPSWRRSVVAGLLGGTLILTRPSVLPVAALVPVALALRWPQPVWRRHALVMVTATAIVVGALLAKNWRERGELTIAQNSAYNLYIGNRALYAEDLNLFSPRATPEQVEFRRQYFSGTLPAPTGSPADLQREAIASIVDRPGLFVRRAIGRLARVFAPKTDVLELVGGEQRAGIFAPASLAVLAVANLQWTAVLFAGIVGLGVWWRTERSGAALLLSVVLGCLPLCLIAISKPRYAFTFEPLLLLAAAALVVAGRPALARLGRGDRWAIGVALGFIVWGWIAWLIFAVTSRLALAGGA